MQEKGNEKSQGPGEDLAGEGSLVCQSLEENGGRAGSPRGHGVGRQALTVPSFLQFRPGSRAPQPAQRTAPPPPLRIQVQTQHPLPPEVWTH